MATINKNLWIEDNSRRLRNYFENIRTGKMKETNWNDFQLVMKETPIDGIIPTKYKGKDIFEMREEMIQRVKDEFDSKLKQYLIDNLKLLGHEFKNDEEFLDFAKQRLTRVSLKGSKEFHVYLDFKDDHDMGTLVGNYSCGFNADFDGHKLTYTIGK